MVFSIAGCGGEGPIGGGSSGSGGDGGSGVTDGSGGDSGGLVDGGDSDGILRPNPGDGGGGSGGSDGNSGSSGGSSGSSGGDGSGGSDSGGDSGSSGGGSSGGDSGSSGGDSSGGDGSGGGGSGGGSSLSGTSVEVLGSLVDELIAAGVEMPMALPPMDVMPELSQNTVGLSESDFGRLAVSAASSLAAIGTFAHQIVIIQAKDAAAAKEIKGIVSGEGGYDPQKWICVWPERAIAVESGAYVLIAACHVDVVEAAIEAFRNAAGSIGEVTIFWEFSIGI